MFIINDVWLHIKSFLFHNIKTQGKHLQNKKEIKQFNKIVKIFPSFIGNVTNFPKIIYKRSKDNIKFIKFIYRFEYKIYNYLVFYHEVVNSNLSCKLRLEYYQNMHNKKLNKIL